VYTTYDSPSDPNFYDDNDFKRQLDELLRSKTAVVVLDIHGSDPYRPYDLDIGTMNGASLLGNEALVPSLVQAFHREGINNISSNWFAGSKNQTMIKFSSNAGTPAIQLELSALRLCLSCGDDGAHRFSQTLQALVEFLTSLGACERQR
jgi:hypothetical protein